MQVQWFHPLLLGCAHIRGIMESVGTADDAGKTDMAVELRSLLQKVQRMDITLLAGEAGLSNLVTWVHMVETKEASDFLDGGQLAFTTGIGLGGNADLLELLHAFAQKKAAGVIVNTGPFIEEIPKEAVAFCDEAGLPLFVVPWKVHLAEIMRICCYEITREEQRMMETAAAFKNAIFYPGQEELYVVPLSQHSFHAGWSYSATVMKLSGDEETARSGTETLCRSLEHVLRHEERKFAVFCNEQELILVLADLTEEELMEEVSGLQLRAKGFLRPGEHLFMGVGRLTKSIRCLYKSYRQAVSIEHLQEKGRIGEERIFYTKLGIYRLLLGIEDRDIMLDYYEHTLKPLAEYDRANGTELCRTLRTYLNRNGSVRETAEELYVHRNTINYQLNKIQEILGIEMSSTAARSELLIAFALQDIL